MKIHRDGAAGVKAVAAGACESDRIHEFDYCIGEVGQLRICIIEWVRVSVSGGIGCDAGELFAPLQHQALVLGT